MPKLETLPQYMRDMIEGAVDIANDAIITNHGDSKRASGTLMMAAALIWAGCGRSVDSEDDVIALFGALVRIVGAMDIPVIRIRRPGNDVDNGPTSV